ncbi:MAG: hypothetical protein AABM30_03375 [Actinomycetota bacterium]
MILGSTLTAVVVGGLLAGIPSLLAAYLAARAQEAAAIYPVRAEDTRTRTAVYEEFIEVADDADALTSVAVNAVIKYKHDIGNRTQTDLTTGGWDARFSKATARVYLYASKDVRVKLRRLDNVLVKLRADGAAKAHEIAPEAPDDERFNRVMRAMHDLPGWYQAWDALIEAMGDDVDPRAPATTPGWRIGRKGKRGRPSGKPNA